MYVWGDSQICILAIEVTVILYTDYFTKNNRLIYFNNTYMLISYLIIFT